MARFALPISKNVLTLAAVSALPLGLFAGPQSPAAGGETSDVARRARSVLQRHCARCHAGGENQGGIGFILDSRRLVESGKVVAGKPESSILLDVLLSGEMPDDSLTKPTADEIADVKQWIVSKAPEFRAPPVPTVRSPSDVSDAIAKDVLSLDEANRPFARYFTLVHLKNAGRQDDELASYRAALSKLVNSLSWKKAITPPLAIDLAKTIFRIDLRDYDWTPKTWETIASRYPYGVKNPSDAQAAACVDATRATQFAIRADWFIASCSHPPLYHEILGLPSTDAELEKLLGVDALADVKNAVVRRAGFHASGVDAHSRLVERHPSRYGAYWKSYEFRDDEGTRNFWVRPVASGDGEFDFHRDASEILFNLPNGLEAFMVTNDQGQRVDRVPVDLGWNREVRAGSIELVTGVSCMSCHVQGIRADHDDAIRFYSRATKFESKEAYGKAVSDLIETVYCSKKEMKGLVDGDRAVFRAAVEKCGAVLGKKTDQVSGLAAQFEDAVDRKLAAAELGLSVKDFQAKLESAPVAGLEPLARQDGAVTRLAFTNAFAQAVSAWELGTIPAHVEDEPPSVPPPAAGAMRFEMVFGEHVVSVDVDRTWRLANRERELTISRDPRMKIHLSAEKTDAKDLRTLAAQEKEQLGERLRDLKEIEDARFGKGLLERFDSTTVGTGCLDLLVLESGTSYRVSCQCDANAFDDHREELERAVASVRVRLGSDGKPLVRDKETMPEKLRELGFENTLEEALARAKAENKLVFAFLKPDPTWYVCPYCERLERVKLGTDSFKDIASQVVPVRIEIGKGGELLKRWQVHVFPALRVLNAQGALVYTVDSQNLLRIEQEVVIAKKVEADFQKVLKAANLGDPGVREDFVGRHLARTDVDSALALYRGYARDEKSEARLRSLEKVAKALVSRGRLDETNAIVSDAEAVFTGLDASARLDQIRLETCKYRLEHAYLERKKDLCWRILDEIAERFPESEIAKHKDEHRKWIETHDPQITDRGE